MPRIDEALLRSLTPSVLTVLGRLGADFAAAEDAAQDALVEAVRGWPDGPSPSSRLRSSRGDPIRDAKGWLITVAWRKFLDATRADTARRRREDRVDEEPPPGPAASVDDTLQLSFLCAHPSLTPSSAVALTLRAVGGLTTRQIAEACLAVRLNRAVAYLHERDGDLETAARLYSEAARKAPDLAERDHLTRQAARLDSGR